MPKICLFSISVSYSLIHHTADPVKGGQPGAYFRVLMARGGVHPGCGANLLQGVLDYTDKHQNTCYRVWCSSVTVGTDLNLVLYNHVTAAEYIKSYSMTLEIPGDP